MGKRRTKKQQLIIRKKKLVCIFLLLLVIVLGYAIIFTDLLKPRLNTLTASYISFNNSSNTDRLEINNIKRMTDKKGIFLAKYNSLKFTIPKKENMEYDIILIPINSTIEDKYIHYILNVGDKNVRSLDKDVKGDNGETIIFHGNMKNDSKIALYMWISKEYKEKFNNVSYEVRIKSR